MIIRESLCAGYIPISIDYPVVNCYITMENHNFSWVNPRFQWAIFKFANCYIHPPFLLVTSPMSIGLETEKSQRGSSQLATLAAAIRKLLAHWAMYENSLYWTHFFRGSNSASWSIIFTVATLRQDILRQEPYFCCLVVGIPTPLKNMSQPVGMIIPNMMGKSKKMFETTKRVSNQFVWSLTGWWF